MKISTKIKNPLLDPDPKESHGSCIIQTEDFKCPNCGHTFKEIVPEQWHDWEEIAGHYKRLLKETIDQVKFLKDFAKTKAFTQSKPDAMQLHIDIHYGYLQDILNSTTKTKKS